MPNKAIALNEFAYLREKANPNAEGEETYVCARRGALLAVRASLPAANSYPEFKSVNVAYQFANFFHN